MLPLPASEPLSPLDGGPLRVLILDDSPADADLAIRALTSAGFHLQSDLATNSDLFKSLVATAYYDIILGDYQIPGWTGMDAFRWLRASGYQTPFVLVTGTLGDELAVKCVREGVSDYALKENLKRLPIIVTALLRHQQLRVDRDRAESLLAASERKYRLLFEASPYAMWVQDVGTLRFLEVNQAAVDLYGFSRDEFLSMTIKEIRPEEEVPRFLERFARRTAHSEGERGTWRHMRKDGTRFDAETSSKPISFQYHTAELVFAQDVTEKLAVEDQLRQAQKMEAVGRLAAGVAHDFNNLLSVIMACCDMALPELEGHPALSRLRTIESAAVRGASLSRQLLAFSRRQVSRPILLEPNAAVREIENLLRQLAGPAIDLVLELPLGVDQIEADPGQLQQVVMNLTVNAHDAMPVGGRLTISTRNVAVAEDEVLDLPGQHAGPYVLLSVTDTGAGMDRETQARIFEPFFTTKAPGTASGLGLAAVYGVVRQSRGFVRVESETGKGTTFRVYFPQAAAAERPLAPAARPAS